MQTRFSLTSNESIAKQVRCSSGASSPTDTFALYFGKRGGPMRWMFLLILASLCGSLACQTKPYPSDRPLPQDWRPAPRDASGNLVPFYIRGDQLNRKTTVSGEYAMLVLWNDFERAFYLFDIRNGTYFGTGDFERFLRNLEAMPCEGMMTWLDTCTVSRAWGMPADAWERLHTLMTKKESLGMKRPEEPWIACYCESRGLSFLPTD